MDYVANHTTDPETGFIESKGYALAFDGERKTQFLELYRANGLRFKSACKSLGISHHTINHHYKIDKVFKEAFDEIQREYAEDLESTSMSIALTPKGVIDRMCQLRRLFPEKYATDKSTGQTKIEINIDGKTIEMSQKREQIIDAQIVEDQQKRVLVNREVNDNSAETSKSVDSQQQHV